MSRRLGVALVAVAAGVAPASSETEASSGGIGLGGLGSGAGSTFGGVLGIAAGKRSEKTKSSQKTLTVVIRFSAAGAVESFTWHTSRF